MNGVIFLLCFLYFLIPFLQILLLKLRRYSRISACGFFTVDRSLVTSFLGTTFTYWVIFVQFTQTANNWKGFSQLIEPWWPPSPTGSSWFSSPKVWTIEQWDFFFYTYMSWHGSNLNRWNHKIIFSFFVRNSLRSLKFLDPKWYFAQFCDPIWAASLLVLDKWGTPLRNDPSAAAGICLNLAPVSTHSENWSKYSKIALASPCGFYSTQKLWNLKFEFQGSSKVYFLWIP